MVDLNLCAVLNKIKKHSKEPTDCVRVVDNSNRASAGSM